MSTVSDTRPTSPPKEDEQQKDPKWKGQSRTLKICHWCAKKQEPGVKPFQACAKCKEVIYCSEECQVASWPHHKGPCKSAVESKKQLEGKPELAQQIAVFKKWHSTNVDLLRHAFICALDLGHNPTAATTNLIFIALTLKPDHVTQPARAKYTVHNGFTLTDAEARDMLGAQGPQGLQMLENAKQNSEFMRKKGGLGLARLLLMENEKKMVDFTTIVLPSKENARLVQEKDDWGDDWIEQLRLALL